MNRLKTFTFFIGLFGALILSIAYLQAQESQANDEQEFVAKGVGAIIGGDEAKATDDALANALRNAVEQVVGTMIQSDILVENYQVLEDRIYSRTKGYVKSYEILGTQKRGDNILEMTVRAVVKKSNLEGDLKAIGLLISQKNMPRLMVLVDEKNMDRYYHSYTVDLNTTENELTDKFLEKGFTFVDREVAMRKLQRDAIMAAINGDQQTAKAIAQESGAEVLIIGKAISKPASSTPPMLRDAGMISCQANLNLKVVRADDGRIIATTSQHSAAAHIDQMAGGTQALRKASALAAEDLTKKILNVWREDVYAGTTIQIRVLDVPTFKDLIQFKNLMQASIRGVKDIYQRDYSGNTGILDVDVKGSANQVAEELVLKDFSPYRVDIVNTTQNAIVVKLGLK